MIIAISHRLDAFGVADRLPLLQDGRMAGVPWSPVRALNLLLVEVFAPLIE